MSQTPTTSLNMLIINGHGNTARACSVKQTYKQTKQDSCVGDVLVKIPEPFVAVILLWSKIENTKHTGCQYVATLSIIALSGVSHVP